MFHKVCRHTISAQRVECRLRYHDVVTLFAKMHASSRSSAFSHSTSSSFRVLALDVSATTRSFRRLAWWTATTTATTAMRGQQRAATSEPWRASSEEIGERKTTQASAREKGRKEASKESFSFPPFFFCLSEVLVAFCPIAFFVVFRRPGCVLRYCCVVNPRLR